MPDELRPEDYIKRAYDIIGKLTPIKADCGELCGAACCKDYRGGDGRANNDENKCGGEDGRTGCDAGCEDGRAGYDAGGEDKTSVDLRINNDADKRGGGISGGESISGNSVGDSGGGGDAVSDGDFAAVPDKLGMLLFPGEINILSQEPGYRFFRIPFMGSRAWFLVCEGVCDRKKRPLACRIFPLAPYIDASGAVLAKPDPRAGSVCPLADGENLDPSFRRSVAKAFRHLALEPSILEYMKLLSRDLDDMRLFMKMVSYTNMQDYGG